VAAADGLYPNRLRADSIGLLLSDRTYSGPFKKFEGFLSKLNDIANAYKHSFINSDLNLIGRDEPMVVALGLPYNDLTREHRFHWILLRDVTCEFSDFYVHVNQVLKQLLPGLPPKEEEPPI
jgi:hypothetical protein